MEKRNGASINVGASSILVIFVLLCLTTFATLSLLSANADLRLSQKAELASDNYWAASNQAERMLARIVGGDVPDGVERFSSGTDDFLSFIVPVGDMQELCVELALENTPRHFRKTAWLLRSTVEWEALEEPMELWDGASPVGLP